MTEYKDIKIKKFRQYIDSLLKTRFPKKSEYDRERDKIQDLIVSEGSELYGKMFYLVIMELDDDINKACDALFFDHRWELLGNLKEDATKLAQFLYSYTRSDRKIATASGIKNVQLNRVKNGINEDLYAFEVYGLAKAFDLKPSELFDYFYGNGPRPVVGV